MCGERVVFLDSSILGYVPVMNERRAGLRRGVGEDAQLVIPCEQLALPCRVTNISEGGAGIRCDAIPPPATRIMLVMGDGRAFEGVTAWYHDGHLGLRFLAGDYE